MMLDYLIIIHDFIVLGILVTYLSAIIRSGLLFFRSLADDDFS